MMLSEKARYLIAGICNSIFGYCIGLVLYETFFLKFHIILILVIANILAISFAFLTYKIYVFKTKGNWLAEYLKCYVVYSGTNVAGILLIWTLVDFFVQSNANIIKTYSLENSKYGITSNSIQLGYFDGGLTEKVPDNILQSVKNNIPLKRLGTVEEMTELIKTIIKTEYINGTNISITGGYENE